MWGRGRWQGVYGQAGIWWRAACPANSLRQAQGERVLWGLDNTEDDRSHRRSVAEGMLMSERIYIRVEGGGLEPLEEEHFSSEDDLQKLIAQHPELLDGEQISPGDPRRWILITREKGIAETSGSSARWALDHLIVDQDAVPTLVEVKRGSNPELRRTIIGQLLEYAAHASETWTVDELRQTFEKSANDPDEVIRRLLLADGEGDADAFWDSVSTNLAARRLRLLFVADEIPDPLARVVEFLNAQMPNIEVLAVEIKQFRGGSSQTLVPRVLGRIAATSTTGSTGPRRKLTRETFLDELTSEEAQSVVERLLDVTQEQGGVPSWGSTGVSIRIRCKLWHNPVSVAWLFPPGAARWMGFRNATFGASTYDDAPPELRNALTRWVDSFSGDDFAKDVSRSYERAWEVDYASAAQNLDLLAERLGKVLSELRSL